MSEDDKPGFWSKVGKGLKTVSEATNPGNWINKAVNDTPQSAINKASGGDQKKADKLGGEHGKWVDEQTVQENHQNARLGDYAKGAVRGFAGVEANARNNSLNTKVKEIWQNGGSHAEFENFKNAAQDPHQVPGKSYDEKGRETNTPRKGELGVTIESYHEYRHLVGPQGKQNDPAVIKQLKNGEKLEHINDQIQKDHPAPQQQKSSPRRGGPHADSSDAIEQQRQEVTPDQLQRASQVGGQLAVNNASLRSDNTSLGSPEGNINVAVNAGVTKSNTVQV